MAHIASITESASSSFLYSRSIHSSRSTLAATQSLSDVFDGPGVAFVRTWKTRHILLLLLEIVVEELCRLDRCGLSTPAFALMAYDLATFTWPVISTIFQGHLRDVLILVFLFKSTFDVWDSPTLHKQNLAGCEFDSSGE